jgi:hypothetical protein
MLEQIRNLNTCDWAGGSAGPSNQTRTGRRVEEENGAGPSTTCASNVSLRRQLPVSAFLF